MSKLWEKTFKYVYIVHIHTHLSYLSYSNYIWKASFLVAKPPPLLTLFVHQYITMISLSNLGYLKGLFTNFEFITFFVCLNERNISYKRSISIKQLWLEIIEKKRCSKSVRLSTVIFVIYNTDWLWVPFFSIISDQSCLIEMDLS